MLTNSNIALLGATYPDPGSKAGGIPGAVLYGGAPYAVGIVVELESTGGTQLLSRSPLILPSDGSDDCTERRRAIDRLMPDRISPQLTAEKMDAENLQDIIDTNKTIKMMAATTVMGIDIWRFCVYHAYKGVSSAR
jgi:hypothetical protein